MKTRIVIEIETNNPAPMSTENPEWNSDDPDSESTLPINPKEVEQSAHTELIKIIHDALSLDHINDKADNCDFDDLWMAGEDMDAPEDYSDLKVTMQTNPNKQKEVLIDIKRPYSQKEIDKKIKSNEANR
jgi:hypothetical protein